MDQTQASGQQVQPCLFFDGRCEEAIEFYKGTRGLVENLAEYLE